MTRQPTAPELLLRAAAAVAVIPLACERAPAEPTPTGSESKAAAQVAHDASAAPDPSQRATIDSRSAPQSRATGAPDQPGAPAAVQTGAGSGDPLGGKFTLADATKGLAGSGPLMAQIRTEKGTLDCKLFADKAPITVANFVGLARGLRPFLSPERQWVKRPGYDGTTFHRVIKGFMIQGGDPAGTGRGNVGYVIPDEIWPGARHDRRGLLCMANRGPNTNAMQFFILDGKASHLDGGYTIFGRCAPDSVIESLAGVPVRRSRPLSPPRIDSIRITRGQPSDNPAK